MINCFSRSKVVLLTKHLAQANKTAVWIKKKKLSGLLSSNMKLSTTNITATCVFPCSVRSEDMSIAAKRKMKITCSIKMTGLFVQAPIINKKKILGL